MTLRLMTLAAGALALTMATASAQSPDSGDVLDMTDWDENDDAALSPEEFTAGHELHRTPRDDYFGDADTITREDFVAAEFERYDLDDDGVLDDVEFTLWRLTH